MSEVVISVEIKAPPEEVWELIMDPHRFGEWVTIHRGLGTVSSDGRPRKGDQMEQQMCLRGANFKVHWTLVACEPARHAIWEGKGPARSRAETEYRLTPVDGGTRFAYRNEFKAPGGPVGAIASRALVGGLPEREARASLKKLKALLESGEA